MILFVFKIDPPIFNLILNKSYDVRKLMGKATIVEFKIQEHRQVHIVPYLGDQNRPSIHLQ